LDIASAQRTAIAKLAKETSFLSYGYDPQTLWLGSISCFFVGRLNI
jgi:hypothetical protein